MGQKVNPIGLRIGIIREWDAKWYAPKTKVADLLHEDLKIRKFLNTFYKSAYVSRIEKRAFMKLYREFQKEEAKHGEKEPRINIFKE